MSLLSRRMFAMNLEMSRDMSEIAVDKTAFPAFQLQMVFEEMIDEHTEPEESHPGIISETSDGRKRKLKKLTSMLRSMLHRIEGER